MDRKDFLKTTGLLCGLGGMGMLATTLHSCTKAAQPVNFTLDLSNSANAALNTVGGSVVTNDTVVIRQSSSTFIALSAICTHEGATVNYFNNALVCPRHGARFDTSGAVTMGPANSPLAKYTVTQSGNILTIKS